MSYLNQGQYRRLSRLHDLFEAPLDDCLTLGAEDERFYVAADGSLATPEQIQRFFQSRIAAGGVGEYDRGEQSVSIGRVVEDRFTWSLEAAGVVEVSTKPYRIDELEKLHADLDVGLAIRDREMLALGLSPCNFSAPAGLSTDDAVRLLAPSSRLRGLYKNFAEHEPAHPGLFTLFQEAVAQISFAPTSFRQAATLVRRAVQWAPLFYAATDNSSGMLAGEPVGFCMRSREWARHNDFTPPGRERAGVPPVLLDLAFGASEEGFVERYLDHVEQIPLLFWYQDNVLRFDEDPSFRDLAGRGEGTEENAALALSLAWFDVRLSPIVSKNIAKNRRWMRVELRSFDGGWSFATRLAALLACGALTDEGGGQATDELFMSTNMTAEKYLEARALLPSAGLDTPFGRTTLRALLTPFCDIAIEHNGRLGVPTAFMGVLSELRERAESRSERHRCSPYVRAEARFSRRRLGEGLVVS